MVGFRLGTLFFFFTLAASPTFSSVARRDFFVESDHGIRLFVREVSQSVNPSPKEVRSHDWDSSHVPIIFDANVAGKSRKLIGNANRNGFYCVLDRVTGEFLAGQPYIKQTRAKGLDAKGRPQVIPGTDPTDEGVLVYPNLNGGTIWFSLSYSPLTGLLYVPAREIGGIYFKREAEYKAGTMFGGGGENELPADQIFGAVRALDATTGNRRWEFKLHTPATAGILSTAGGLVFSGSDEGNFFALDSATGKPLWEFQTGGSVGANPSRSRSTATNVSPSPPIAFSTSSACSSLRGKGLTHHFFHGLP